VTASINTERIELRINPTRRRADRRLQRLTAEQYGAYVELLEEVTLLNATTGSEYVDGDFSRPHVLEWCHYVTDQTLDAMEKVGIVEHIEGDRYRVEFSGQTSHFDLQALAERNADRSATQRANYQARNDAQEEAEERTKRTRGQASERSRQYRARQRAAQGESEQSSVFGTDIDWAGVSGRFTSDEEPAWG
jgi:hypothetical protein